MLDDINLSERQVADTGMRQNLYLFLIGAFDVLHPGQRLDEARYLEAMCYALQGVVNGRTPRLMISIAPRHLKSVCGSILFPAFLLGHFPEKKVMTVSYGGDLAREHGVMFRRLIESRFYQDLFPRMRIDPKHDRIEHMKTTEGGGRQAVSLGGAVTGFGADVIVIDDLAKASDVQSEVIREQARTFFDETLFSRLNDKRNARIVSLQQRLHQDDFSAYLLEKGTFHHLCLPSIAEVPQEIALFGGRTWKRDPGDILSPDREPREVLDQIKADVGTFAFRAQYQQDPQPGESEFLSLEDLVLAETLPNEKNFVRFVQSWDTAVNDGPRCDYSVCLTFGWHAFEESWYLLDVLRQRLKYPDLKDRVQYMQKKWRCDLVLIEDSANGSAILQELRREVHRVFRAVPVNSGKLDRFVPQTDWLKSGKFVIPSDKPWFDEFRRELLAFPNTTHNDQVDALTQFAKHIRNREKAYLDTDPETGRRRGLIRPRQLRRPGLMSSGEN
ncbi:phage terminase large subunit [Marimonas lutisalis]|uniref:phage terminase large subunit n=1 Tax=Marimonas lutisalis TaxID=2545756 RepID=UPI00137556C8|nr:phage terminase large subunit [Marimonas lutisalis]